MDDRKKTGKPPQADDYAGLNEATAGWDPYISDLLSDPRRAFREERRRAPRDRSPSRRRSLLLSEAQRDKDGRERPED